MTDLGRLSHPVRPRPAPLCLAAIARGAATDAAPLCAGRRLVLRCELPAAAPARGHAGDLHHALMNLLLNAIRFTPDDGRITLTLRRAGGVLDLALADTGIGIAAGLRDRIGEPFFTACPLEHHHSDPIAFRSGGIGLGLAVARAIAADHGGRLWFESEEHRGSTFHLELPAAVD
jgi:signal transduction histidine kinase